eukprot:CAMPEP_0115281896 /NCGR_PEP_ID=MMETSP0270-20121206/59558_1 /TAXON_ID=71861 /ORGANISM="Scrippsiella trochoidea, Strain CCMP3099" /LENGTH=132 /DNA_ID=CAMNT_0002698715 /DNA_START=36 /DNA_END=432 /DNA_ORIENTATION=-
MSGDVAASDARLPHWESVDVNAGGGHRLAVLVAFAAANVAPLLDAQEELARAAAGCGAPTVRGGTRLEAVQLAQQIRGEAGLRWSGPLRRLQGRARQVRGCAAAGGAEANAVREEADDAIPSKSPRSFWVKS